MATSELTPTLTIAERVGELVQIPSVNPLQAGPKSGDGGEVAISAWMAERCADMGAQVTTDDILDGRQNVYARFQGDSDRVVTVDVHLDTVGVEHMTDPPFDGRIEGDRVWGRGSVDTKATLPIVLSVLEELQAEGKRPTATINVVGTVSEEMGGLIGAQGYAAWLESNGNHIDQLIVAEPTMCAPVHGHKGGCGLEVTVHGHAAHSSKPHLGTNAISAAARIIVAIDQEQARLAASTAPTAVGTGTVSINEVTGGVARNIIPPIAELYCGRRVAPGERAAEVFEQLSQLVRDAAAPVDVAIEMANGRVMDAFYQDPDGELVKTLANLAGTEADVAAYGSNALCYPDIASEVVIFGPGSIDQAHQAVEWIDIAEIERAANVYRTLFRA